MTIYDENNQRSKTQSNSNTTWSSSHLSLQAVNSELLKHATTQDCSEQRFQIWQMNSLKDVIVTITVCNLDTVCKVKPAILF